MAHDDWQPTASLDVLRARARLLDAVRRFFIDRGYWEVETPLLSRDTCIDTWIDPVAVPHPGRAGETLFLQTSPEFAMKRLLAAGADAIFEITRSFRRGEAGRRHNPEFTILEWYRVGDTHHAQMNLVADLVRTVAALPLERLTAASGGGQPAEFALPAATTPAAVGDIPRITYDEAAHAALGATVVDQSVVDLRRLALDIGLSPPASLDLTDRDGWLNLLLSERIEPWLARYSACFLYDYPASQAALARIRPGPPDVAERFELYLGGIEVCNGYHELTEADELARRMQHHNAARMARGQPSLPTDSRLIDALRRGLPPCAGVALGFDRLVMWRLGLKELREIMAFPLDRA